MSCHKAVSTDDPDTLNEVLRVVSAACTKKSKKYREAALSCLEQVIIHIGPVITNCFFTFPRLDATLFSVGFAYYELHYSYSYCVNKLKYYSSFELLCINTSESFRPCFLVIRYVLLWVLHHILIGLMVYKEEFSHAVKVVLF